MKVGRRLATKILNVSRFVLGLGVNDDPKDVDEPLDRAMLAELADVVESATASFNSYDYARALQQTERFFWSFCDDYVELVKVRAYGEHGQVAANSARAALALALSTLLRLFAPFVPFCTEEVWSWWQVGSVHRARWPDADELRLVGGDGDRRVFAIASEVVRTVRKAKSDAKQSMRAEAKQLFVRGSADALSFFEKVQRDVQAAGHIEEVELSVTNADYDLVAEVSL